MERLYRELVGRDFEILAVSVDDRLSGGVPADALRAFADEFELTFPLLHSAPDDPENIQRSYQTTGVPESFLIGRDGVIYRRISGATTWDSRSTGNRSSVCWKSRARWPSIRLRARSRGDSLVDSHV